jgi:hypothetical protein
MSVLKADNLTAICEPNVLDNVRTSTSQNLMGLHRDNFTLFYYISCLLSYMQYLFGFIFKTLTLFGFLFHESHQIIRLLISRELYSFKFRVAL